MDGKDGWQGWQGHCGDRGPREIQCSCLRHCPPLSAAVRSCPHICTIAHGQMCLVKLDQRRDKNDREHDEWDHKEGHPWIQKGLGMLGDVWVCLGCFETGIETRKAPRTRSGSVPEKLEKPAIFAHHAHVTDQHCSSPNDQHVLYM